MKQLSIEEKAKRYDEAIKLAKDSFNYPDYPGFIRADVVFPEIKESEDERIRKGILHLIGCASEIEWCKANVSIGEVQTWFEKQGVKPDGWNDGDILYNKDSYASDSIFIFKGMADRTNAYLCYARLYGGKDFYVYSKEDWDKGVGIYGGEFYPANHKQKELLFSEIEKAGYKCNPDTLTLEKVEKPSTIKFDEPDFERMEAEYCTTLDVPHGVLDDMIQSKMCSAYRKGLEDMWNKLVYKEV